MLLIALIFLSGCRQESKPNGDKLVNKAIAAHGMEKILDKALRFNFREHSYTAMRTSDQYTYTREHTIDGSTISDILHSSGRFERMVNGMEIEVPDSMAVKYSASVNSVLYFMQLPLVLNDKAAIKSYLGDITIRNSTYHTVRVVFNEEDGGEDFQDEFRYWINSENMEIDYLAYSYLTEGGGVRFREALNKRRVGDILFQDYNNYKPNDKSPPLDSLPDMFERGELKLLSTIVNTEITVE